MKAQRPILTLSLSILLGMPIRPALSQPAENCEYRLYPLFDGNRWTYDIMEDGKKTGTLEATITGHTTIEFNKSDLRPNVKYYRDDDWPEENDLYHMRVKDSRGKEYERSLLVLNNGIFIYTKGKLVPFLPLYVYRTGQSFNGYVVVELTNDDRKNSFKVVGPEGQVESYEYGKGLVYYHRGTTEYRLSSIDLKGCSTER